MKRMKSDNDLFIQEAERAGRPLEAIAADLLTSPAAISQRFYQIRMSRVIGYILRGQSKPFEDDVLATVGELAKQAAECAIKTKSKNAKEARLARESLKIIIEALENEFAAAKLVLSATLDLVGRPT